MTAAEKATTTLGGLISGAGAKSGPGLVMGLYTATKANAADWIEMNGEFAIVRQIHATNDGTGALDPGVISASTKVTLSVGTGATTILVIGTPKTV